MVQPLLVSGLLVALFLGARWSGRALTGTEWAGSIALCAALAVFLVEASPTGGTSAAPFAEWVRVAGPVLGGVALFVVLATRVDGRVRAGLLGCAAGGLFGISSSLAKTFVEQIQHGVPYTAAHWEVYTLAAASIVGIVFTQNGFQSGALATSLPALEATEPVVAALIGATALHERFTGHSQFDNVLIGCSIVVMIVAVVVLASEVGARAEQAGLPGGVRSRHRDQRSAAGARHALRRARPFGIAAGVPRSAAAASGTGVRSRRRTPWRGARTPRESDGSGRRGSARRRTGPERT